VFVIRRLVLAFLIVGLGLASSAFFRSGGLPLPIVYIYVSTAGNDSTGNGSIGSPYLTAAKAQTVAQAVLTSGKCPQVYFRGGTYALASTLSFGSADSGSSACTATWSSYPGEKAIWSGGIDLTGTWSLCITADSVCNSGSNGIYKSSNTSLSAFRELYVAGSNRERSRSTDGVQVTGWTQTAGGYTLSSANFTPTSSWKNLGHLEVIIAGGNATAFNQSGWQEVRCTIGGIASATITMGTPCWTLINTWLGPGSTFATAWNTPWFIENAYELLPTCALSGDGQGCWYYDYSTGTIYYKPVSGETINSETIIAPQLLNLATFTGASYLKFSRLTFSHQTWNPDQNGDDYVSIYNGYYATGTQAMGLSCESGAAYCVNLVNTTEEPGALSFSNSSNHITFDHNLFTNNGGRSLFFGHGSQNMTVTANKFTDNGGGAIQWGEGSDYAQTTPSLQTSTLLFQNNQIDPPFEYLDNGGFFAVITTNATVENNSSSLDYYIPFALGYGYSIASVDNNYAANNTISNNLAPAGCTYFFDCGSFYIGGGPEPNLLLSGNYGEQTSNLKIHACFYFDDGTTGGAVTANVCDPGTNSGYWMAFNTPNTINNSATGNFTTNPNVFNAGSGNTISGNTTYTSGSPPAGATAIINAAGIQAGVTPGP
jgi:hypothetical protein